MYGNLKWSYGYRKRVENEIPLDCTFRSLIRRVISNLDWLADTTHCKLSGIDNIDEYIEEHRHEGPQFLTLPDKIIFNHYPVDRTEEEIYYLMDKFETFKGLNRFSPDLKRRMLQRAQFRSFKPGVRILREGHGEGFGVYFITRGNVISDREYNNPITQEPDHVIKTLRFGDTLGEDATVYREPHPQSMIADEGNKYCVELLFIERGDFEEIIESTILQKRRDVRKILNDFTVFHGLEEIVIRAICDCAEIVTYPPHKLVKKKNEKEDKLSHFIVEGSCVVIERFLIDEKKILGSYQVKLNWDQRQITPYPERVRCAFLQTCILGRRGMFCIGERMAKQLILTRETTKFLVIPRFELYKHNVRNIWSRCVHSLNCAYPSQEVIRKAYQDRRNWNSKKSKTFMDTYRYKGFAKTAGSIHEVALSVRAKLLRLNKRLSNKITENNQYYMRALKKPLEKQDQDEFTAYFDDNIVEDLIALEMSDDTDY